MPMYYPTILQCKRTGKTIASAISALFIATGTVQAAGIYAPWLTQIGISDKVLSAANWGKGSFLGVVDTGIVANNLSFAHGQVSVALSACAAVSFHCPNGFVDDNGHGTAVAEIAAGNLLLPLSVKVSKDSQYAVLANSLISVAPNATIFSEKVLSAQGSATSADVANGVKRAADAGASVINVSITYSQDMAAAINYAASKGAFIVWAGGNESTSLLNGVNTTGLTATAIQHLVFAGSVDAKNKLSYFSNTPGSGALVDSSSAKTAYKTRWAMAPGESIIAPYAPLVTAVSPGNKTWGYWSGTSMASPVISGSLLLLESAWPVLKTKGTAANLLLATTVDLGKTGADASFGMGLVNLDTAFQPYGTLVITQANGKAIAVSNLTGKLISSGALGDLSAIRSSLANYRVLDDYARDFLVNLSGLIQAPSGRALLNPLPVNTNTGPAKIKLAEGGELSYRMAPVIHPVDKLGVFGFNAETVTDQHVGYAMLTDREETSTAIGYGFPVRFAYAKALYGNDDFAKLSSELSELGVSNLSGLAQGGGLLAYGMKWGDASRFAFSWSGTASTPSTMSVDGGAGSLASDASTLGLGATHRLNDRLTVGMNLGFLNEHHGLLGSLYNADSPVSLGASNQSKNVGFSAGFNFSQDNSMLLETGFSTTKGHSANGLFVGTSTIQSRSYGMTFMSKKLFQLEDRFTASMSRPLRIVSGRVGMVMPSIDEEGIAHFNTEWVSLVPTGRQTDYKLGYDVSLAQKQTFSLQMQFRQDVANIVGSKDASIGTVWTMKF